jgi:hypothetical protein
MESSILLQNDKRKGAMENAVTAVPKLIKVLNDLSSDERKRAVAAAMLLLGEAHAPTATASSSSREQTYIKDAGDGISAKAAAWMAKNQISRDQLEHVFSVDEKSVDVIAHKMPSDSKRKQTAEAYVTAGLMAYISSGELEFTDDAARDVCKKVGCYDQANHANYMKAFSNWIGGTKAGWKLSNPGLTKAAEIVKSLAPGSNA